MNKHEMQAWSTTAALLTRIALTATTFMQPHKQLRHALLVHGARRACAFLATPFWAMAKAAAVALATII